MKQTQAQVHDNRRLTAEMWSLTLCDAHCAQTAVPGQFVEISTRGVTLLNKPISIASTAPDDALFTLIYKVIGPGTRALSAMKPGDAVRIIGPCGTGFPVPESPVYAVGGGCGIPPISFLAQIYGNRIMPLLAARTAESLVQEEVCAAWTGHAPMVTTDDGSKGLRGQVAPHLAECLATTPAPVYACGPLPMLRAVAACARAAGVSCFVSLEAYMGCGFGVCMGCVVPTVRGYERVCKEGPVFPAEDIVWDACAAPTAPKCQ